MIKEGYKDSVLGEIPVEWEVKKLEAICDVRDGTHDSPKYYDTGIPFVTSKNLSDVGLTFDDIKFISKEDHLNFSKRSHVENGDILFGMIGTVGKPVIVNENFDFSIKNVALLKFNGSNTLNNVYALNILKSSIVSTQFIKLSNGGVLKFVALGNIRSLKFPLPPLPEQQKIASILSTADQKIEVIDQQIAETQELKKGLMQKLLTKGIGHTKFKDSALGEIPESWEVVKLGDIGEFFKGKGISKSDLKSEGEHPCVRYGEIYTIYHTEIKKFESYIDEDVAKSSYKFNTGDLLFTGSGETIEDIGKCVTYLGDMEAYASGDIVIHRPNKGNSQYLSYYMNSELIRSQTRKLGQGNSVVHIYAKHLGQLVLSLPPIEEQQKIASILSTVDEKLEVLQDKKAEFQELKKGLMQQLLTGKTRVKLN